MTAAVLIVLIAAGLYFFAGAWGVVLLWLLAMFFVLFWAGLPALLFMDARQRIAGRRWGGAAVRLLGGLATGAAWLLAMAYLGYRAFQAIP